MQEGDPNEDTGTLAKELIFAKQNLKKQNLNQVLNNELPSESEYSESAQNSPNKQPSMKKGGGNIGNSA